MEFDERSYYLPTVSEDVAEYTNDFAEFCNNRGATCLISAVPVAQGEFSASKEDFEQFQHTLEEALDCEVISKYTDYFYDYKYFYNTKFHLTDEGLVLRTQQLIRDLEEWGLKAQEIS